MFCFFLFVSFKRARVYTYQLSINVDLEIPNPQTNHAANAERKKERTRKTDGKNEEDRRKEQGRKKERTRKNEEEEENGIEEKPKCFDKLELTLQRLQDGRNSTSIRNCR